MMTKRRVTLMASACTALLTSASFFACSDEALTLRPDLSLVYNEGGKVDIILPPTFAGVAVSTNPFEAAFVAEIEQSILQTIELFPHFRPSTVASNAAKAISIHRVDLYKQRTVSPFRYQYDCRISHW